MHFENLFFILLVALILLIKWVSQRVGEARREANENQSARPASSTPRSERPPAETEDERIRRFLEALGQPVSSKPPPKIVPRTPSQPPRRTPPVPPIVARTFGPSLPPLTTRPPEIVPLPVVAASEPNFAAAKEAERRANRAQSGAPIFEVDEITRGSETGSPPMVEVMTPLRALAKAPAGVAESRKESFVELLRTANGLRQAVILREVFAAPVGLRPQRVVL